MTAFIDNWVAEANPTADDNLSRGYGRGSKWFNLASGEFFVCSVASIGDATWVRCTGAEPLPVADFTFTPDEGESPLTVAFTNTSTGGSGTFAWEKSSNGGSSWSAFAGTPTAENPSEDFTTETWSVRLTVTNDTGSDTHTELDAIVVTAP